MRRRFVSSVCCACVFIVAMPLCAAATVITFEGGTILSSFPSGVLTPPTPADIGEYIEGGYSMSALSPGLHYHILTDSGIVFNIDGAGIRFRRVDLKPFSVFSATVSFRSGPDWFDSTFRSSTGATISVHDGLVTFPTDGWTNITRFDWIVPWFYEMDPRAQAVMSIDDVYVEAVPEPPAIALLLLACVCAAFGRHRSRRSAESC